MTTSGDQRSVPRLAPAVPFPPYAFVPGRAPHPESDPAGHSFGRARGPAPALDPEHWQASTAYLYGLDLFNAGFYWESHLEWESLWLAAGRRGAVADFLKGLIQLAAAGVKHREGRPDGVRGHAHRAAELWRGVRDTLRPALGRFLGLCLADLIARAEEVFRQGWPCVPPLLLPDAQPDTSI
jgi:uncharacterized protein